ncbi:hypothetical protein [Noviherbaspirillum aerium]|uniref:hypothetical protein n=1 Tax=Noviherbaspirillum aerium TaxID=2588497 RepID=UPI00124C9A00|nr:hypothetical protein [Noviherbaspirillum aerium]
MGELQKESLITVPEKVMVKMEPGKQEQQPPALALHTATYGATMATHDVVRPAATAQAALT